MSVLGPYHRSATLGTLSEGVRANGRLSPLGFPYGPPWHRVAVVVAHRDDFECPAAARWAPLVVQSGPVGQALLSDDFAASASARALLPGVIRWVSGYFDRPLLLNGAIVDAQDQQVHAFFETVYRGQPVRGTLGVFAGGGPRLRPAVVRSTGSLCPILGADAPADDGSRRRPRGAAGGATSRRALTPGCVSRRLWKHRSAGGMGHHRLQKRHRGSPRPGGQHRSRVRYTVPVSALPGFPGIHGPLFATRSSLDGPDGLEHAGRPQRGEARMTIIEERPTPTQSGRASYVHYKTTAGSLRAKVWPWFSAVRSTTTTGSCISRWLSPMKERFPICFPHVGHVEVVEHQSRGLSCSDG